MQWAVGKFASRRVVLPALVIAVAGGGMLAAGIGDPGRGTSTKSSGGGPSLPADGEGVAVYRAAKAAKGMKILVSTEDKWLWLVQGRDTLVSAPIAIGLGNTFSYNGKNYVFKTPRGKRIVRVKQEKPVWTVPEWHYYEKAHERNLEAVHLKAKEPYLLGDGTTIEVRGDSVGRINQFGNWWPFSQDFEIIFDEKIFVPPLNTIQRRVTDALGPYKLDMGEGYLIHGTHKYNEDSIGTAASHGCVRMRNVDLTVLYELVDAGTPVYIF